MNLVSQNIWTFLQFGEIKKEAWETAKQACQRWDVPADAPADLADKRGRGLTTAEGYRVSSLVLPRDFSWGGRSPAIAIAWFLMPWSILLFFLLSGAIPYLGGLMATMVAGTMATFAYSSQTFGGIRSFYAKRKLHIGVGVLVAFLSAGFALRFGLLSLLELQAGHTSVTTLMPPPSALVAALVLSIWPAWKARNEQRKRLAQLHLFSTADQPVEVYPYIKDALAARKAQAERAKADKSPFFELGTAAGVCSDLLDLYAPDKGLPFGLSQADLSTHLLTLGRTGTGKTSAILRPLAKQWIAAGAGGLMVLDGKGELPAEFAGLDDFQVLEPGKSELALIAGLKAEDVVNVLAAANANASAAKDPFWENSAQTLLLHAAVLLEFSEQHWTLANLGRGVNEAAFRQQLIEETNAKGLGLDPGQLNMALAAALFFRETLPAMAPQTAGSIVSTVNSWLAPLVGHRDLTAWASTARVDGIGPLDVLTGAKIGILCPAYRYGAAGPAVAALIKAQIYRAARDRGSNWERQEGQKQVLLLVDEAQEVLGKADTDMLPVARSLGLAMVAGTQSIEAIESRIGDKSAALAFLGNFRSFAAFAASPGSMKWVSDQLGEVFRPDYSETKGFDLFHTATSLNAIRYYAVPRYLAGESPLDHQEKDPALDWMSPIDKKDSSLAIKYKVREMPLLSPAEIQHFLSEPFAAVCQVNRAGVARRDVVRTQPIFY